MALTILSLCLHGRGKHKEAVAQAQAAIHHAPDVALCHYALSVSELGGGRLREAEAAIEESIRLDPGDARNFAHLATIRVQQEKWAAALEAAEAGLAAEPEHADCATIRAMALIKLGRKDQAGEAIEGVLAQDPENDLAHSVLGMALLHQNEPAKAVTHFREALRLEPTSEMARDGIIEALKARNFLYRLVLRLVLGLSRYTTRVQWTILITVALGYIALRKVAAANPQLAPYLDPLLALFFVAGILTWVANPLATLVLRLDPLGRRALTRDELMASNWMAAGMTLAILGAIDWWMTGNRVYWTVSLMCAVLTIPLTTIYDCPPGKARRLMAWYTAALAVIALVYAGPLFVLTVVLPMAPRAWVSDHPQLWFKLFMLVLTILASTHRLAMLALATGVLATPAVEAYFKSSHAGR